MHGTTKALLIFSFLWILTACEAPSSTTLPDIVDKPLMVDARGAVWVAVQDGDGPWIFLGQHAALTKAVLQSETSAQAEGVYVIALRDETGRYGVASVCTSESGDTEVKIKHSTSTEDGRVSSTCPSGEETARPAVYAVSGEVSGLTVTTEIVIGLGRESEQLSLPETRYTTTREYGLYDLVALRRDATSLLPERFILRPNLFIDSDRQLDLDFDSAEAFSPSYYEVVVQGLTGTEPLATAVTFRSEHNTTLDVSASAAETFRYAALPPPRSGPGAVYEAFAFTGSEAASREIFLELASAGDISLTLPEPLAGEVEVTAGPAATWPTYEGGERYVINFKQESAGAAGLEHDVELSSGWLGTQTSYALPDFGALEAWQPNWALQDDAETAWRFTVRQGEADEGGAQRVSQSGVLNERE